MLTLYTVNAVGLPEKIRVGREVFCRIFYNGRLATGNTFQRVVYAKSRDEVRAHFMAHEHRGLIMSWKHTDPQTTTYYGVIRHVPKLYGLATQLLYIPKAELKPAGKYSTTTQEETEMSLHVHIHGNVEATERALQGKYVVMVKFNQLSPGYVSPGHKTYGYMTNDSSIKVGDFVAVMSPSTGVCATEVVDVLLRRDFQYNASKWIIGKIDLTAYRNREENEKRLNKLRREIDQKKQELAAKYDLQMVAEDSPEGAKLVDEYESLMRALGETDY